MGDDISIVLKPVLGIKPERYLIWAYGFVMVLILFLLFLFPGILNHGSKLVVLSNVEPAALYVDNVLLGPGNTAAFVKSGSRDIRVRRPGFQDFNETVEIPGRLFFSLFVPRRHTLTATLEPLPQYEFPRKAAVDIASWSFTEVTLSRQLPPLIDELSRDLYAAGGNKTSFPATQLLPLVKNDQLLRDYLRGSVRSQSNAQVGTPAGISGALSRIIRSAASHPLSSAEFARFLKPTINREGLNEFLSSGSSSDRTSGETQRSGNSGSALSVPPMPWIARLKESFARMGYAGGFSLITETEAVMVAPLQYGLFKRFTDESEIWKASRSSDLEADRLTFGNLFLSDPRGDNLHKTSHEPVRGVNMLAIGAFVEWLSTQSAFSNYSFRLPSPAELNNRNIVPSEHWEYAGSFAVEGQMGRESTSLLSIRLEDMARLNDALIANDVSDSWSSSLYSAPITVYRAANDEFGVLSAALVSPVTTFRLVVELR